VISITSRKQQILYTNSYSETVPREGLYCTRKNSKSKVTLQKENKAQVEQKIEKKVLEKVLIFPRTNYSFLGTKKCVSRKG